MIDEICSYMQRYIYIVQLHMVVVRALMSSQSYMASYDWLFMASYNDNDYVWCLMVSNDPIGLTLLSILTGNYSCSVILMNEKIGEFLYTVEVKAVYPTVSSLPFKPGKNNVRISSAAAASMYMGII